MSALHDILEALSSPHPTSIRSPLAYRSLYHWVLLNGTSFESQALTKKEWGLVKQHIHYTVPSQCFANCQQVVLEPLFPQIKKVALGDVLVLSPFDYVEGYVVTVPIPIPIHHAWLSLRGKVIDPTLRSTRKSRRKRFPGLAMGTFPDEREYYGAVIPWRDVASCVVRNLAWHTVLDDYKHGWPLLQEMDNRVQEEVKEK